MPVTAETAALSAVQEGAAALVVDVAGPHPLALEGQELEAFAAGWSWSRSATAWGWLRPGDDYVTWRIRAPGNAPVAFPC